MLKSPVAVRLAHSVPIQTSIRQTTYIQKINRVADSRSGWDHPQSPFTFHLSPFRFVSIRRASILTDDVDGGGRCVAFGAAGSSPSRRPEPWQLLRSDRVPSP